MDIAMRMFCDTKAQDLQGDAQENRPWKDRTGDARKRLKGSYEKTVTGYRLILAHGVDYGKWLELAHEKKYAIIEPTIRLSSPKIMKDFKGMMNALK
jgi:hypothetical protein